MPDWDRSPPEDLDKMHEMERDCWLQYEFENGELEEDWSLLEREHVEEEEKEQYIPDASTSNTRYAGAHTAYAGSESESDPAPASSSSSFSQYEDSEQASRDDEEMATMILPHRPVPPTPDQNQVQAALQKMVKHEMEARLKAVEIWGNGALSEEEKREQYSRWQAKHSGPFIP
ncbi:hypothetical protein THAOC_25448 [Thalassiosira oceanica]|uniref:Uncharacterized protein n=1 Tax=Thalassiosira oceanica TaxID=159749 RepID=K0S7T4_THAOC|nr:hypothetical protein THAOC_25448 [Thalassiosira oceanica]|eukprot:EJK54887.1 hypothetical protein THAOC_25448 [Thalassiosira oceanica]